MSVFVCVTCLFVIVHLCLHDSYIYILITVTLYVYAPIRKNSCADYREGKIIINQSINQSS